MAETVYKDFKREEMEYQFNPRTTVDRVSPADGGAREGQRGHPREADAFHRDVRYGDSPRMTARHLPRRDSRGRPVHIYIHGGYWRGGGKDAYSFIAEPFVEAGVTMVLLEYDLCPQVTVPDIMRETREGIGWVLPPHRGVRRGPAAALPVGILGRRAPDRQGLEPPVGGGRPAHGHHKGRGGHHRSVRLGARFLRLLQRGHPPDAG